MRSIGLDLGLRKIAMCEVRDGEVIRRATVATVSDLAPYLGPGTGEACVAIEACRMAWAVHAELVGWGHEVKLVDTS